MEKSQEKDTCTEMNLLKTRDQSVESSLTWTNGDERERTGSRQWCQQLSVVLRSQLQVLTTIKIEGAEHREGRFRLQREAVSPRLVGDGLASHGQTDQTHCTPHQQNYEQV